ncbi:MAG TPA: cell division protein FtsL [Terriglobales bacterium]|nr:cell division protein FtsL [Terriglobales bacterium]
MAAAAIQVPLAARRRSCWNGTPEIYFAKALDNSRLVKVEDPRRTREMKQFGMALACLFLFVMAYAFQHFKAIEYGYRIESLKSQRDNLVEMNRVLALEEASLRDPERIDRMARELGLQSPQAGQVVRMDAGAAESPGAVVASLSPVAVVSAR